MLENFQDIDELYKIIVFQTDFTVGVIADALGYTRSHFTRLLKGDRSEKVEVALLDKMKQVYEREITQFVRKYVSRGKTGSEEPSLTVLRQETKVIAATQRALVEIMMVMAARAGQTKADYNKYVEILRKYKVEGILTS